VVGIVLVCASMVAIVVYGLTSLDEHQGGHHPITDTEVYPFLNWKHYPLFFGNAAFLFCIHTVAIPIHTSMSDSVNEGDFDRAVNWSSAFVATINILFAVVCFWIYGDDVKANIVQNMPADNALASVIKVLLVLVMIFTYGLFIQPLAELLESMWSKPPNTEGYDAPLNPVGMTQGSPMAIDDGSCLRNPENRGRLIRIVIILLTAGLALCIPDFGLVCNLVGAVANTLIGLVLPSLFYIKLKSAAPDEALRGSDLLLNAAIVVFAIILMITSATVTVISIVCVHATELGICKMAPFDQTS